MMLKRRSAGASREVRQGKKQIPAMDEGDKPQQEVRYSERSRPARRPLLEMWLPANAQAVPAARHRALDICRQAGVGEEACVSLDLALGEALANAVVHGAPTGASLPHDASAHDASAHDICLCIWHYRDRLIVEVHDHGPGFDPPAPPYPMPPASAQETHGRGLPLMEMLTDALVVCRGDAEEGGASIYLVKKLSE